MNGVVTMTTPTFETASAKDASLGPNPSKYSDNIEGIFSELILTSH